ncbi:MAG: CPBP family intramembrane glutamic endopeptidase [Bacteroidota bacterium]
MKKILGYLKAHVREDFSLRYYAAIALFLAICLSINYYLDFEDSIIDSYYGNPIRIVYFFLFYGFAYYGATMIIVVFKKKSNLLRSQEFWVKSLFILAIIALDGGFHYHTNWVDEAYPREMLYFASKVAKNAINIFTMIIPMVAFYYLYDRELKNFYGLTRKNFDIKPYAIMIAIMIPIIFSASFIDNFNKFYPIYKANRAHLYLEVDEWVPAMIYELFYGWNFLTIELAFRGFMIIGLAKVMGRDVVIPMVATYCFYHFGKPEGEAISSIFGGYILGIIALESRNVWGGVIIHVGIAWMMEFFAWVR